MTDQLVSNKPQTERNAEIKRLRIEEHIGTLRLSKMYHLSCQRIRQICGDIPQCGTIHGPVVPKIDKP